MRLYKHFLLLIMLVLSVALVHVACGKDKSSRPRVATPSITPAGGPMVNTQMITITCATAGASIVYTTGDEVPTKEGGIPYTGPVRATSVINALAYKDGMSDSAVATEEYSCSNCSAEYVKTPSFSVASGSFTTAQNVTISCATTGASIKYTTDGSSPSSSNGIDYTAGNQIAINATTVLKAIALKTGAGDSLVAEATYIINAQKVLTPYFIRAAAVYATLNSVAIFCNTDGAQIIYTLNGSDPSSTNGTNLASGGSVTLSGATRIKAIAVKSGWTNSEIVDQTFTLAPVSPAPTLSPAGGKYTGSTVVTITPPTGYSVRYTVYSPQNPNILLAEPDAVFILGTVITTATNVTVNTDSALQNTRIVAFAYKSGCSNSNQISGYYYRDVTSGSAVQTPSFSINGGTFDSPQIVTIMCATAGAKIMYTLDGSQPTATNGTEIQTNGTVTIANTAVTSVTLKAWAYMENGSLTASGINSAIFVIQKPVCPMAKLDHYGARWTLNPDGLPVTTSSDLAGTTIVYTTDNSVPTLTNGTQVAAGSSITLDKSCTLKLINCKDGYTCSGVMSEEYTLKLSPPNLYFANLGCVMSAIENGETGTACYVLYNPADQTGYPSGDNYLSLGNSWEAWVGNETVNVFWNWYCPDASAPCSFYSIESDPNDTIASHEYVPIGDSAFFLSGFIYPVLIRAEKTGWDSSDTIRLFIIGF